MKRQMLWVIVLLLVFSLACASFGGKGTEVPDPAETQQPGDAEQPEPVQTEEADESPPALDANALAGLDSYRSRVTIKITLDDGTEESISIEQEAIREPYAQRMVMTSDTADSPGSVEIIQVGQTQWMRFGEEWIQTEANPEEGSIFEESSLISPDDFSGLGEDNDYKYLGKEKVNGVQTRHYSLKANPLTLAAMLGSTNLDEASVEVWVANENNLPEFPVRYVITAKGEVEEGKTGAMLMEQDVYDINASFTIEPPADAATGGLPEDVPAYPGATGLSAFGGTTMFETTDDVATVTEFYRGALADNGWAQGETTDMEGLTMDTWSKEGRTLSLMISSTDAGGASVMITIEGE